MSVSTTLETVNFMTQSQIYYFTKYFEITGDNQFFEFMISTAEHVVFALSYHNVWLELVVSYYRHSIITP
jgi:hypothetical protein